MSRYGGFRKGRKRYKDSWDQLKSVGAQREESAADTPQEFSYVEAKGIWSLRSTVQFPKSNAVGAGPSYALGLSGATSYIEPIGSYQTLSYDLSQYAGATIRMVWRFVNPTNTYFQDVQIDDITIGNTNFNFEADVENFQTSNGNVGTYSSVTWSAVPSSATSGQWSRLSGNTGSVDTGALGAASGAFYLYAETSSPANISGYNFWLRSPEVVVPSGGLATFKVGLDTKETSDFTIEVYVDVIS